MTWFSRRVLPFLQLCRFAAVFTAIADIAAGLALTGKLESWQSTSLWLLVATVGLYLSGMAWNDYFDREIDAVERPKRPLPSGRVTLGAARVFAGSLMVVGGLAALVATWQSGRMEPAVVALLLIVAILGYDVVAKNHAWGPLVMGLCRFLNLLLGASLGLVMNPAWWDADRRAWDPSLLPWLIAAGNGVYIVGVTLFSRNEAGQSSRSRLVQALGVANLGLLVLGVGHLFWPRDPGRTGFGGVWGALVLWIAIVALINRVAWEAVRNPGPQPVQVTIRTMLTSLILLDALVVLQATQGPWWALGVLLLRYPAQWIGRRLAIT